jgi:hypothetical protein
MLNQKPEVLVCGAGCAGLGAALAAARQGASTLLVERAPFAGGIITCTGLPYFDGIARKQDNRIVVRGIALELLSELGITKMSDTHVARHNAPIHSVERFKLVADRLLQAEPKLQTVFHAFAVDVVRRGDRIAQVLVATKAGLLRLEPKVVIDATGDADVAARAEVPLDASKEYMPMSMHFRIGNVRQHPELRRLAREATTAGHQEGLYQSYYGPGISFFFADDEAYVHAVRVTADATDPLDLTRAEMQGRRDAYAIWEVWKKRVPGFENSYFISSGPYIGIRESRRIVGEYLLTEHDIKDQKSFDDAVATGCWYLDLHPSYATAGTANVAPGALGGLDGFQPDHYDIPYRSLLARKVSNLLVAGRCHSATRMAASSTRVTVTAMAMGQAAGTAAAFCSAKGKTPQEINGRDVRDILDQQHAGPFQGENAR